ncbi:MAG TPA: DUF58 domain-containing protein [Acidimicrobiia bacterium]|nr:DUF58 domain-containing protein [Acidimicrobiia bacterium]
MFSRKNRPPSGVQPIPRGAGVTPPSQVPVERLRLTVMQRLDGLLSGDYGGLFPGHGSERGEARPYVPGDDPRHIDWAVTARNHEPHVRDMIADHELDVWIVLDSSSSLGFGTGLTSKHEIAWSVAGAFGLLASTGGNRVGAVKTTVAEGKSRPQVFPARGGSAHTAAVLTGLRTEPLEGVTGDLAGSLDLVARSATRRGMVVVISDFLGEDGWERALRRLASRHEVIAVEVIDPREIDIPDVGLVAVVDPETGERRLLDTGSDSVRDAYARVSEERRADVASALKRAGADHLVLRTDGDWVLDFVRFVSSRKTRLMSARRSA